MSESRKRAAEQDELNRGEYMDARKRSNRGAQVAAIVADEQQAEPAPAAAAAAAAAAAPPAGAPDVRQTWPAVNRESLVWRISQPLKTVSTDGKNMECLLCGDKMKKSTTSNFMSHIRSKHNALNVQVLNACADGGAPAAARVIDDALADRQKATSSSRRLFTSLRRASSNLKMCKLLMFLHWVCYGNSFHQLNSDYLLRAKDMAGKDFAPNDDEARQAYLPYVFSFVVEQIKSTLSECRCISVTNDTWSRKSRVGVITARYLNADFAAKTLTIVMYVMVGAHTSVREAPYIRALIDEYTNDSTIIAGVVTDTENKARRTGRMVAGSIADWVGCFAHLTHLAVGDFIAAYKRNASEAAAVLEKVRSIVRACRLSALGAALKSKGYTKEMLLDVLTRWNSTYVMLERFLDGKRSIKMLVESGIIDASAGLSSDDWNVVSDVVDALAPVAEFTTKVCGTAHATLSCVPMWLQTMREMLTNQNSEAASGLIKALDDRLGFILKPIAKPNDEGGGVFVHAALRAAALDPRYADLPFLDEDMCKQVDEVLKIEVVDVNVARVGYTLPDGLEDAQREEMMRAQDDLWRGELRMARMYLSAKAPSVRDTMSGSPDNNPFQYWVDAQQSGVKLLAEALLCIPASSADSERAFSSAGFLDDPLCGRMSDVRLAQLVVIRDWAKAVGVDAVVRALEGMCEVLEAQEVVPSSSSSSAAAAAGLEQ